MRTLKRLKVYGIFHGAACGLWIALSLSMVLAAQMDFHVQTVADFIMTALMTGLIAPVAPVMLVTGILSYFRERKDPKERERIGGMWIGFPLMFMLYYAAWMACMCVMIMMTGGV